MGIVIVNLGLDYRFSNLLITLFSNGPLFHVFKRVQHQRELQAPVNRSSAASKQLTNAMNRYVRKKSYRKTHQ